MTSPQKVEETLRPWLGSAFLARRPDLCAQAAAQLRLLNPGLEPLMRLKEKLDNLLFMAVREDTGGRLALMMDDGRLIRLRTGDFTLMADELLYLLFQNLPADPFHQALIRDYSMRSGSLSALRALYLHYRALQPPEETEALRRVITSCHPPWRFRHWMDG